MKKITILALHLGYGGVEQYIATIANILSEKYDVEIISTYKLLDNPPYAINNKVKIKYLLHNLAPNKEKLIKAIKKLDITNFIKEAINSVKIMYLKKYKMIKEIKNLDCDIAMSTRVLHNKWLSKYGNKKIIKIASEHRYHNNDLKYINKLIKSCKNIDFLMPVSQLLTNFYEQKFKDKKTKCIYISHCLDQIPEKVASLDDKQIVSVGRLSSEKAFVDLINIFSDVSKKHPDWKLNIIGDGIEKEKIIDRIKQTKCSKSVVLHGYQDKNYINKVLSKSSIYVMTSLEESFGLVLIEACSYGIPCLAFDSAEGAKEIITDSYNGYLIKNRDKEDMIKKINLLIENGKLRTKQGKNSRSISLNFSKEKISAEWYELIYKIVGE